MTEPSDKGPTEGRGQPPEPVTVVTVEGKRHEGSTFWGWLRKTARLWGFLAVIAIVLIVFRKVILPFVLAALAAYILAPVMRFLCKLRFGRASCPRFVWLILLYTVLLGLQVLFVTTFVPRVSKDFKRVVQEAPALWARVRETWIPAVDSWVEDNFGAENDEAPPAPAPPPSPKLRLTPLPGGGYEIDAGELNLELQQEGEGRWIVRAPRAPRAPSEQRLTDAVNRYLAELSQSSEARLKQVLQLGQAFLLGVLNTITTFILVLMISAFMLLDPGRIVGALRSLVPESSGPEFDHVVSLIDKGLSGAIRGQLLICIINGVLTWLGLIIIGVKYSLLLGVLAGVMSLIPIFGSILSSIPIVIVALVSGGGGLDPFKGLMMLAWIIGIHLLEANLLNPKIIGTAARIHPVVVIFAVVAGERTYGPIGALLGVPLVSALQAVFIYLRQKVRSRESAERSRRTTAPG